MSVRTRACSLFPPPAFSFFFFSFFYQGENALSPFFQVNFPDGWFTETTMSEYTNFTWYKSEVMQTNTHWLAGHLDMCCYWRQGVEHVKWRADKVSICWREYVQSATRAAASVWTSSVWSFFTQVNTDLDARDFNISKPVIMFFFSFESRIYSKGLLGEHASIWVVAKGYSINLFPRP